MSRSEIGMAFVIAFFLDLVFAYLFYDSAIATIFLSPVSFLWMSQWWKEACHKRELEFRNQFQNSIQIMASMLKAGYSVENAIRETGRELATLYAEETRIRAEYEQMGRGLNMNLTAEQVLRDFANRVQQEDVDQFVTVFTSAKRMGGDSIEILRESIRMIGGKAETEREIEALVAAKKMEFRLMCIIPLGMIFYMRLAFPEFLRVLYGNLVGIFVMSICFGMYLFAYWLGNQMVRIEV